jgi:hypothetical protein
MTTFEIVRQAFYYAGTCRSLWFFGFFVGLASGGSNGSGGGGGEGSAGGGLAFGGLLSFFATEIAVAVIAFVVALAVAGFVMRFLSEGALIEGIVRARQGGAMTTREGFRAGWTHWGVLARIAIIYFAAIVGSAALLVVPCVIALRAFGVLGAAVLGVPALLVAVPWFITLSLVQAFALRIAVLENRRALDAIGKARLFLHGRLIHGLKLMVADFVGTVGLMTVGVAVIVPVVLLLAALATVLPVWSVLIAGGFVLLPALCVLTAMMGTFRSSVWTLGYLTQVDA